MPEIVVYTEDCTDMCKQTLEAFSALGLQVQHFETNTKAQAFLLGDGREVCIGLVVDQVITGDELQGVQLLRSVFESGIRPISILSASVDRLRLETQLSELGLMGQVEVFDKVREHAVAVLFMAIKISYPDIPITRETLLGYFEFELDIGKNSIGDAVTRNAKLYTRIVHAELNLNQTVQEFIEFITGGFITINSIRFPALPSDRQSSLKTDPRKPSLIAVPRMIGGRSYRFSNIQRFCPLYVDKQFRREEMHLGMTVGTTYYEDALLLCGDFSPIMSIYEGEFYVLDPKTGLLQECPQKGDLYNLLPWHIYYLLPSYIAADYNLRILYQVE